MNTVTTYTLATSTSGDTLELVQLYKKLGHVEP